VRTYVIETYVPRARAADLKATVAHLRAAVLELRQDGAEIRYLHSTFVPEDEICFHVLQGSSRGLVARVGELAALTPERIVEAVE